MPGLGVRHNFESPLCHRLGDIDGLEGHHGDLQIGRAFELVDRIRPAMDALGGLSGMTSEPLRTFPTLE